MLYNSLTCPWVAHMVRSYNEFESKWAAPADQATHMQPMSRYYNESPSKVGSSCPLGCQLFQWAVHVYPIFLYGARSLTVKTLHFILTLLSFCVSIMIM